MANKPNVFDQFDEPVQPVQAAPKRKNVFDQFDEEATPQPQSTLDAFMQGPVGQFGTGAAEGLASLPGIPLDVVQVVDNFGRRNLGYPEMTTKGTPLEKWGGQGWADYLFPARKNAPGEGGLARKAGLFFGGAIPFGPAGMIPAAGAVGGSEIGRMADESAPELTKGYGEVAGALVGGLAPSAMRRSMVPRTTPEQAHIAQDLMAQDVPVYPGQLATNPMTRNVYDLSNKLSVYDNGAQARQSDAVARVLSRTMGENETNLVEASRRANERLGGTPDPQNPVGPKLQAGQYDQIYARIGDHALDNRAVGELQTLEQRALQLTDRSRAAVDNALNNVQSALNNGRLSIRGFKDLTDQGGALSELSNNANPALALYGNQLRQILENNIRRQATPADAQALMTADSQWRHMKTLEPVISRSQNAEGQVSPSLLQGAVATSSNRANARGASGMPELETVARAGKSFLKNPITSGTAERSAIINLMAAGGPGGMLGGILGGVPGAAAGAAAGIALPLAGRFMLQRQWLTRMMIDDALRRGANPNTLRRMLTRAAPTLPGAAQQQALPPPRRMLTRAAAALPGSSSYQQGN